MAATGLEFETEERAIVFDSVAEVSRGRISCASSEGPNGPRKGIKGAMNTRRDSTHSGSALLIGLFGDGWAPFFVTDSPVQDQPDQPTLSMSIIAPMA